MKQQPLFTLNHLLCAGLACGLVLAMQGCASTAISPEAQANAAAEKPAAPSDADFPALDKATWKQGSFPSIEGLRRMETGMGKDQVRNLLSYPHFNEGLFGAKEWNYIFHFRTGKGAEYVTCQYMVRFNKDVLTHGMYWKDPGCAKWLAAPAPAVVAVAAPAPAPVVAPAPAPAPAPAKFTLAADGLFRFDGAAPSDLSADGRTKIVALAGDIKRKYKKVDQVTITGHTDRLGSDVYNEGLALARANTIRELLVDQGIDRKVIETISMGKRRPVVTNCTGSAATPELIACLQPNRRVELDVLGQ